MLENFSFVIPGLLAGAARPGTSDHLAVDLQEMTNAGVGVLVTLTEASFNPAMIREAGMEYHHIPVVDFSPPSDEQFARFVHIVEQQKAAPKGKNRAVLVHCAAGIGRTGSMIAAYLISQGLTTDQAIAQVRQKRPGSVETNAQVRALEKWASRFSNA
ncbi:MAG: dual specificity protein phosphatase family protein [Sumerlaeia bacterium]